MKLSFPVVFQKALGFCKGSERDRDAYLKDILYCHSVGNSGGELCIRRHIVSACVASMLHENSTQYILEVNYLQSVLGEKCRGIPQVTSRSGEVVT